MVRRKPRGRGGSAIDRCLVQLKRMVPAVRGHAKIKKLELLQHVIDYIQDLELTLAEDHLRKSSVSGSSPSTQRNVLVSTRLVLVALQNSPSCGFLGLVHA